MHQVHYILKNNEVLLFSTDTITRKFFLENAKKMVEECHDHWEI